MSGCLDGLDKDIKGKQKGTLWKGHRHAQISLLSIQLEGQCPGLFVLQGDSGSCWVTGFEFDTDLFVFICEVSVWHILFLDFVFEKTGFGVEVFVHSVCQVDCKNYTIWEWQSIERFFSSKMRHTGSEIYFPSDQKFQIRGDIFCREISCQ